MKLKTTTSSPDQTPTNGGGAMRVPAAPESGSDAISPLAAGTATIIQSEPDALVRSANSYASEARAHGTRKAYAKHWTAFAAWCDEQGLCPLPAAPQTLALYLAARVDQGRKVATLALAITAISQAHQVAGHPSPRSDRLVKETWKGIRRRVGVAQNQKHPVSAKDIRSMLDELPSGLIGLRDRALITLGFAGGFRRSELVALNCDDLVFVAEGSRPPCDAARPIKKAQAT
jgi:integrase